MSQELDPLPGAQKTTEPARPVRFDDIPWAELDLCAEILAIRNILRWAGKASIIWGIVNLCLLSAFGVDSPFDKTLSVALILEGIVLITVPRRWGLIPEAILLLGLGVSNASVLGVPFALYLTITQFIGALGCAVWYVMSRLKYPVLASPFLEAVESETEAIKTGRSQLATSDSSDATPVLVLKQGGMFTHYGAWKVRLGPVVVALYGKGFPLHFLDSTQFRLETEASLETKKSSLAATLHLEQKTIQVRVSTVDFQRYQNWVPTAGQSRRRTSELIPVSTIKSAARRTTRPVKSPIPARMPSGNVARRLRLLQTRLLILVVVVGLAYLAVKMMSPSGKLDSTPESAACRNNLLMLGAAKEQVALERPPTLRTPVSMEEVRVFLRGRVKTCPKGGHYTYDPVDGQPSCSVHGKLSKP